MSKPTAIPVRFNELESDIKNTASDCGISVQDTIRIAVRFGLPKLIAKLGKKKKAPAK